ncbi:MAG: type II secretion system major pseudopilin GspG [Pseudomonadota bacterium]
MSWHAHKAINKSTMVLKQQQGFTLMEVMVVLVILGLLMGVVAPNVIGQLEQARIDTARNEVTQLVNALESYKMGNNRYPTTEQGLDALVTKPTTDPVPKRYIPGGYIKKLNQDPWSNYYQYIDAEETGDIQVYSMGPDGQDGTGDEIGNWEEEEEE